MAIREGIGKVGREEKGVKMEEKRKKNEREENTPEINLWLRPCPQLPVQFNSFLDFRVI